MAPPHTHSRKRNLQYACAFTAGACAASLGELLEAAALAGHEEPP